MQTNPQRGSSREGAQVSSLRVAALTVIVLIALLPMNSTGAEFSLTSGPARVALLELYTSEGCSSCPPAEAWLAKLENDPRLWTQFVPVAFHVDYWDRLGWRDTFARREFTERQRRYAAKWSAPSVYTPGFVWNGAEWKGWFRGEAVPVAKAADAGRLTARTTDRWQWSVAFAPADAAMKPATVHLALLGFDLGSDVKAGENRGRKLSHSFITLALADGKPARSGEAFTATLTLPDAAPDGPGRRAIAAWVTASDGVTVLQAAGGWLPREGVQTK